MEKEREIILSNSLENLAERMIDALFFADLMQHPFEKRLVVVPDMAMKEFLVSYCAYHPRLQVCAGLQIQLLGDAMNQLHGPSEKKIPSAAVLSLAIEEQLWTRGAEDPELDKYLACSSEEKKGRRIAQLSDELARLFAHYGLHGVHFLKGWLSSKERHWQKKLFCTLFQDSSAWSYPIALYRGGAETSARIALFGFHYLTPVHLSFFTQRGASIYALSPSMVFWGDFVTDKEKIAERRRLMRKGASAQKIEVIQRYLDEGHPLLNNWGKLGREMLKNLDAFTLKEVEAYDFKDVAKPTLLSGLKRSLLMLEKGILTADHSLQIHSATSKLREVEALFQTLENLLISHEGNGDPLRLRDVLIYAPDIAVYAPYIAMVLSQRGCPYAIQGLPLSATSSAVRGFLLLLEVHKTKGALHAVMALFENGSFQEKTPFSGEELSLLHRFFAEAEIREGWKEGIHSWEMGVARLLQSFAVVSDPASQPFCLHGIGPKELDLMDRFLTLLHAIEESLQFLCVKHSAEDWFLWAGRTAQEYLAFDVGSESFFQELQSLALQVKHWKDPLWSFESIERVFLQAAEKRSAKWGSSERDKIRFASLGPGRLAPARLIWCLGMDEGAFPRSEAKSPLNLIDETRSTDYFPSRLDEDRAIFLELLLSAQDYLMFSYERVNADDHKEQSYSLLIDELNHYAEHLIAVVNHAPLPFHAPPVSSQQHRTFFEPLPESEEESYINLSALKKCARHPLQFYMQKRLRIYLKEDKDEEAKEFLLSRPWNARLRQTAMHGSFEGAINHASFQGKMPRGIFGQAALCGLNEETEELFENLDRHGVRPEEVHALHLCEKPGDSPHHLPPLQVAVGSRIVSLVGTIADVTPQGLLVRGKWEWKTVLPVWPLYLVYRCVIKENLPLLFSGRVEPLHIDLPHPEEALASYLEYYFLCHKEPSPLMPNWGSALLQKSKEEFAKEVRSEIGHYGEDPYLSYLRNRGALEELIEGYERWSGLLRNLFAAVPEGGKREKL